MSVGGCRILGFESVQDLGPEFRLQRVKHQFIRNARRDMKEYVHSVHTEFSMALSRLLSTAFLIGERG